MHLNYKEYGSGQPIIILHGLLGMLDNWHSFAKILSEEYWVISVDQRNHGRSFHSDEFSYALLAEDLKLLMEQLHIPRCHILGHSMGGKTVMTFLSEYNDMIDKAIIVDISPLAHSGGHETIFEALSSINVSTVKSRNSVQEVLLSKINNLGTVQFLMKNLNRDSSGHYNWRANITALKESYQNINSEIIFNEIVDTPVLFIKGQNSNYINEEDEAFIHKIFSNAQIHEVENAGHWVHSDQPTLLMEIVKTFLKD